MGGTEEAPDAVVDRARAVVLLVDEASLAFSALFSLSPAEAALSSVDPLLLDSVSFSFVGSGGSEETAPSFDTSAAAASDASVMIDAWSSFFFCGGSAKDIMPMK